MKNISGKTAVITGAGSGIGRALAIQLAAEGVKVLITDYDEASLNETLALVEAANGDAKAYVFDVADRQAFHDFAEAVVLEHQHIDILINNAGVALGRISILKASYDELEWIININLWGVIHGTKAFLPHLLKRPESALVNISSVFGITGIPLQAPYCTTKFAVRGFTESLRMELMRPYPNISVSCVHPGGIKTNIVRNSRDTNQANKEKLIKEFDRNMAKTTAEDAAAQIIDGIKRKKARILIGSDARMMDRLARWFPVNYMSMFTKMIKFMEGKRK